MYIGIWAFLYWDHVKPKIPRDKNKTAKKLTNFLGYLEHRQKSGKRYNMVDLHVWTSNDPSI